MTRSITAEADWLVLHNAEGRWSVWPATYPLPAGWQAEGSPAPRAECLARIETLWADPRPLALRAVMA